MKKFLSALISLILCIALSVPALAETQYTSSTVLYDESENFITNIDLAADALEGATIQRGKVFSFNETVGARTAARGYKVALNGRGAVVMAGGVAQVASTLYLALKQIDGISYPEKCSYGSKFAWNYVESNKDAIIVDYRAGTDFRILNKTDTDLRIAFRREADALYCMVYPVDSEDSEPSETPDDTDNSDDANDPDNADDPQEPAPEEPEKPESPVPEPSEPEDEPDETEVGKAQLYQVYRCQEYINLHKSASVSAESIAQIPLNATLLIKSSSDTLYKAQYNGLTGYVNKKYVKPIPASSIRQVVKCSSYVSLREAPTSTSARLQKLPLGTLLEYMESADNGYAKVRYENMIGYVITNYLTTIE